LQPKRRRFIPWQAALPPAPFFSRFLPMPIRSRFFTPPAAPLPPRALNSRFTQNTPPPVSKFLPPAAGDVKRMKELRMPAPTIRPALRRLHALWKARNFRKPPS
jgi:hypothetical protein